MNAQLRTPTVSDNSIAAWFDISLPSLFLSPPALGKLRDCLTEGKEDFVIRFVHSFSADKAWIS